MVALIRIIIYVFHETTSEMESSKGCREHDNLYPFSIKIDKTEFFCCVSPFIQ